MTLNDINWDVAASLSIQVLTLGYLVFQFHILPTKEKKASIENFIGLYGVSENLLNNLIQDMEEYCLKYNCFNEIFQGDTNFQAQLNHLYYLKGKEFKEGVLENMLKVARTKDIITTATNSMNAQITSFTLMQAHFNTLFKFNV